MPLLLPLLVLLFLVLVPLMHLVMTYLKLLLLKHQLMPLVLPQVSSGDAAAVSSAATSTKTELVIAWTSGS